MPQPTPALDIAQMILDGFDDYREHFRQITDGARERFEKAQWQQGQAMSSNTASSKAARSRAVTSLTFSS